MWLDASDSSTVQLTSGLVSQWGDKSGNNNHAIQNTASYRPTYSNNSIVFDGIDDYLESGSDSTLDTNTMSWFAVFDYDGITTVPSILFRSSYASGADFKSNILTGLFNHDSGVIASHARDPNGTFIETEHPSTTTPSKISTVWNAPNISSWLNVGTEETTPNATAVPSGHEFTVIGKNSFSTPFFWNGKRIYL